MCVPRWAANEICVTLQGEPSTPSVRPSFTVTSGSPGQCTMPWTIGMVMSIHSLAILKGDDVLDRVAVFVAEQHVLIMIDRMSPGDERFDRLRPPLDKNAQI